MSDSGASTAIRPLGVDFYERPVLHVAKELIGCVVAHAGSSGVIVETEAYHDSEPACHAFVGVTARTQTLFGIPGRAYVYRSYGVHALLNAVCEHEGIGAAVLIRALSPLDGLEQMWRRRGASTQRAGHRAPMREQDLCSGPGKLTQALGVELAENGTSLLDGPIGIFPRPHGWRNPKILAGPRIGITKAVELPWRFCVEGDLNVSEPRLRGSG